jgi:hypothetical protein
VAEWLGRRPLGVELLPERVDQIRTRLNTPSAVIAGDARQLTDLVSDEVTLILTSPPYMTRNDHPENPLEGYATLGAQYRTYVDELEQVFGQAGALLKPGGHAVVNVANIRHDGMLTTLAWDLARVLSRRLTLQQECCLAWDSLPVDISGDYCLVFTKS